MKVSFLDFESPIAELEDKIDQLRYVQDDSALDIADEISRLSRKSEALTKDIYAKLSPWQISQVSRHPQRPYTLDYIKHLFTDFEELHGDRAFGDDKAIVGGLARFNGQSVVVIGHQKGRDTKEKIVRNFGMPRPEGYRKALRLMRLAEKFGIPIMTFIDTPGAYPGVGAEERGKSAGCRRDFGDHRDTSEDAGAGGQDYQRTAGRRTPGLCGDHAEREEGVAGRAENGAEQTDGQFAAGPLQSPDELWQVQGSCTVGARHAVPVPEQKFHVPLRLPTELPRVSRRCFPRTVPS